MKLTKQTSEQLEIELQHEEDTVTLGGYIGSVCNNDSFVMFLFGDLGAGKTTLSRGIVRAFGHKGAVKSPTYTLVEPYELETQNIYHFDLYRLAAPEELHYLGLEDYFAKQPHLCLVEWPEKGEGALPPADWLLNLDYRGEGRCITITANPDGTRQALSAERLAALATKIMPKE